MNYDAIQERFDLMNQKILEAKEQMKVDCISYIEEAVSAFLDENSLVERVYWTQYTPYFNDGDTCYFSVNELCFSVFGDEDASEYEGTYFYNEDDLVKAEQDLNEAIAYEKNPTQWKIEAARAYKEKNGRSCPYSLDSLRPYPNTEQRAREIYNDIKDNLEKYDRETTKKITEDFSKLSKLIQSVPEDIMLAIYGDHSYVVIDRSGTTIEEHSHD
jgi:hypothetical protein